MLNLIVTGGAALVGAGLATVLRLPAAPLLGALAGVATVNLTTSFELPVPSAARWLVYVAVGALLGTSVDRETLAQLRVAAVPILLTVVGFLLFGLAVAWVLWRFSSFDAHTALLATAPGGIAQMGVLSAEAKANVPVVLTVHVLRITSVIVLMSVGLRLMGGRG